MMLFILTGDVQIGKTRWLQRLVDDLGAHGVPTFGVIAPGQWVPRRNPAPDEGPFDKLGIDNVLLPEGTVVPFARRADLARESGTFDEGSQAAQAELAWHISDEAIAVVNNHFAKTLEELGRSGDIGRSGAGALGNVAAGARAGHASTSKRSDPRAHAPTGGANGAKPDGAGTAPAGGLLVVDELGRLELLHDQGLTAAVALLECGPTLHFPHALAVVRDYLLPQAVQRFGAAWNGATVIGPTEQALALVESAVLNKAPAAASTHDLAEAKRQIDSILHKLRETKKTLEAKDHPERLKAQITLASRRIEALTLANSLVETELTRR